MFCLLHKIVPLNNHGSQFRESRKTSAARVRLDPFHDVCSAFCTWWCVTRTPRMSAPQQLSPDGDTPWAGHKGTLGRSLRGSCTPFTLAANLRDQAILEWFWVLKACQGIKESMFCFPSISRGQLQKFFYYTAVQKQNKNYMRTTTLDKALPR